eukprot:COSAG02_NODE_18965_length_907_cov_1.594059_2_plen_25_part_01
MHSVLSHQGRLAAVVIVTSSLKRTS